MSPTLNRDISTMLIKSGARIQEMDAITHILDEVYAAILLVLGTESGILAVHSTIKASQLYFSF